VVKRWLRYVEKLNGEGKRSGRGLVGFQKGNAKGSVDLVNCQEGRGDILNCQVGKGEEMSLAESTRQQGVLTKGEEKEERPHPYEDSYGTAIRVNEDDDKLETSITEEKDQRSILVIGEVEIFLPNNQGEVSIDVVDATEGQQDEIVMEEEEQILKFVPTEEENPVELLTQWEMDLKELEDSLDSPELEGGCHEIAMLEETYQHELQLGEARMGPVEELTGVSMSEEVVEQQFSGETVELESAAEWPIRVTRDESCMGDQDDRPIEQHEELQPSRLHERNQPMEQLEEVVEEIRRLMLRSAEEAVSKEKWIEKHLHKKQGGCKSSNNKAEEQKNNSRRKFGIQEDFNRAGKLMSRIS
jgi:hypothetical protein